MDIESYKKELGEVVEQKINQAISQMTPKLCYGDLCDLKLYIPKIAIDYLIENFRSKFKIDAEIKSGTINRYRGYEIVEGYELAIIFVHKDYALYQAPELISRVKL